MSPQTIETLTASVTGEVVTPSDPGYDDARTVYNQMIDRRPAAVVRCADAKDVAAVVRHARETGRPLAVRGGGHSVPGFGTADDAVVADLSGMRTVDRRPGASHRPGRRRHHVERVQRGDRGARAGDDRGDRLDHRHRRPHPRRRHRLPLPWLRAVLRQPASRRRS